MIPYERIEMFAVKNNIELGKCSQNVVMMYDNENKRDEKIQKFLSEVGGSGDRYTISSNQPRDILIERDTTGRFLRIKFKNKNNVRDAKTTSLFESSYCYVLSKLYYDDVNHAITKGVKASDIALFLSTDTQWNSVIVRSCKLIYSDLPKNRRYSFERKSKNVAFIENVFKIINNKDKFFHNINKWNPSDIWIFDLDKIEYVKSELKKSKTYEDLNNNLKRFMEEGDLFGISLKKAINPVIQKINFIETTDEENRYTIDTFLPYSSKGDFFSTATTYIYFTDTKSKMKSFIEMRADGSSANSWVAEIHIKGSKALHGKINRGTVENVFNRFSTNKIKFDFKSRDRMISDIIEYSKLWNIELDINQFDNKNDGWVVSKYCGLYLMYSLSKEDDIVKNKIVEELVKTAKSQSTFSAPHLKLEQRFSYLKNKSIIKEQLSIDTTIGLVPMAAKPFHVGHMKLIEYASSKSGRVYVIVSTKNRSRKKEISISGDTMSDLWRMIIKKHLPDNVKVIMSNNPISDVAKIVDEIKDYDIKIFTGKDDVENYNSDKYKDVKIVSIDREDKTKTVDISGTEMRKYLEDDDKSSFIKYLPDSFSDDEKNQYYNKLHKNIKHTLKESKNLHIDHLEDLIFDGIQGFNRVKKLFKDILISLKTRNDLFKIKFDGSPSIVFGQIDDKFFVSTKSFFNKTPKICYTEEDCKEHFGDKPDLVSKMNEALKYLSELNLKGIYQGDFLYDSKDLKYETIDGVKYVTFCPNTLTYAVKENSEIGNSIKSSKIGFVVHTKYDSYLNSSSITEDIKSTSDVWIPSIFLSEKKFDDNMISSLESSLNDVGSVDIQPLDEDYKIIFLSFINDLIKNNKLKILESDNLINQFLKWCYLEDRDDIKALAKYFKNIDINKYIKLYKKIIDIKEKILDIVDEKGDIKTYFNVNDVYVPTSHEGFVVEDEKGFVKIVNRKEFSKQNFLYSKNRKEM